MISKNTTLPKIAEFLEGHKKAENILHFFKYHQRLGERVFYYYSLNPEFFNGFLVGGVIQNSKKPVKILNFQYSEKLPKEILEKILEDLDLSSYMQEILEFLSSNKLISMEEIYSEYPNFIQNNSFCKKEICSKQLEVFWKIIMSFCIPNYRTKKTLKISEI